MPLLKKTQRSFSGGQLDKDLMGRQDLNKYSQGCLVLENFKVRKQGNVIKRSGTDFVCDFSEIKGADTTIESAKLIPLIQERESGLYILMTGGRAYLVSREGVKMNDGTWSRTPAHAASPSTLAPYSIEIPFADADLAMVDWCQSGDTLFFAHRTYPPGKIEYANGELEYERIQFRQGSGTPPSISSITQQGSGWTGTGGLVHLEYAVTAVKDGIETGMSVPFATEYNAPWPSDGSILITIDTSSLPPDSWDFFNIYKKEVDVFGLIGTTSSQMAFVDISSGFSVTGDLYPSGYTVFDKQVHLREGGNRFASVSSVNKVTLQKQTAMWGTGEGYIGQLPTLSGYGDDFMAWLNSHSSECHTEEVAQSATAQKTVGTGVGLAFSLGSGHRLSTLRLRIGALEHFVEQLSEEDSRAYYGVLEDQYGYCYWNTVPYETEVTSESTKWTGIRSVFTACPAKYFTATVEYWDGSAWATSGQFECDAGVDQTSPGEEWSAVAGASNKWHREYTDADAMWSYTDGSTVLARMDANAPQVGATVAFTIPAAYEGKLIRTVTVYGWTDSTMTSTTGLVVNGLACYQKGSYVNTFTDSYVTPDLTITPPKTEDHFVNPGEYPGCVQLYSQRLVYASSANEPFTFWMSATGDLYNFDVHEYVRASDSIKASTAALEMPRINRMLVHRDLMMFAEGGEWEVAPSVGNAVAPSTVAAKLQSTIGCAAWLKPIPVDSDIIFCDSSGETLLATRYNFATDGYESSNLSVLSQRLFRNNPIKAMAYAQFPESTVECVLADGTIASLVYMREHDVCAWSHHVLGGQWMARDIAANKSVSQGSSHCALIASRRRNVGTEESPSIVTQWAILSLRDIDPNDKTLAGNLRLDAVRTTTTTRAEGATQPTQPALGDGEVAVRVGTSGQTDFWAIGCAFKSVLKTTSPEFTDKETAQMEVKNATESEIRVIDGSDFTVRQPEVPASKATRMKVAAPIDTDDEDFTVAPGDADCRMPLVGTNSINGSIVLEHDGHLPLSVLSVTTSYRVEFANHANGGSGDD